MSKVKKESESILSHAYGNCENVHDAISQIEERLKSLVSLDELQEALKEKRSLALYTDELEKSVVKQSNEPLSGTMAGDIESFLRQLSDVPVERVSLHTGLYARAKASELINRLDR